MKVLFKLIFISIASILFVSQSVQAQSIGDPSNAQKEWNYKKKNLTKFPLFINPEVVEVLDLRHNKIQSIEDDIAELKNLKELRLSRNPLTYISEKIGELKYLEKLDLWNTEISELPEAIFDMKHLKEIDLRLCPVDKVVIQRLLKELPNTKIRFTYDCNC